MELKENKNTDIKTKLGNKTQSEQNYSMDNSQKNPYTTNSNNDSDNLIDNILNEALDIDTPKIQDDKNNNNIPKEATGEKKQDLKINDKSKEVEEFEKELSSPEYEHYEQEGTTIDTSINDNKDENLEDKNKYNEIDDVINQEIGLAEKVEKKPSVSKESSEKKEITQPSLPEDKKLENVRLKDKKKIKDLLKKQKIKEQISNINSLDLQQKNNKLEETLSPVQENVEIEKTTANEKSDIPKKQEEQSTFSKNRTNNDDFNVDTIFEEVEKERGKTEEKDFSKEVETKFFDEVLDDKKLEQKDEPLTEKQKEEAIKIAETKTPQKIQEDKEIPVEEVATKAKSEMESKKVPTEVITETKSKVEGESQPIKQAETATKDTLEQKEKKEPEEKAQQKPKTESTASPDSVDFSSLYPGSKEVKKFSKAAWNIKIERTKKSMFIHIFIAILFISACSLTTIYLGKSKEKNKLKIQEYNQELETVSKNIKNIERRSKTLEKYVQLWQKLPENNKNLNPISINEAKEKIQTALDNNLIFNADINISKPVKLSGIFNKDSVSVNSTAITIEYDAMLDGSIFDFIEEIEKELPGYVIIESIDFERMIKEITKRMLYDISKGNFVSIFKGEIKIYWFKIDKK